MPVAMRATVRSVFRTTIIGAFAGSATAVVTMIPITAMAMMPFAMIMMIMVVSAVLICLLFIIPVAAMPLAFIMMMVLVPSFMKSAIFMIPVAVWVLAVFFASFRRLVRIRITPIAPIVLFPVAACSPLFEPFGVPVDHIGHPWMAEHVGPQLGMAIDEIGILQERRVALYFLGDLRMTAEEASEALCLILML